MIGKQILKCTCGLALVLMHTGFASAATISLTKNPDTLVGSGTGATGGGMLDESLPIYTSIVSENANNDDIARFEAVGSALRTWIGDFSDGQVNWDSRFQMNFDHPLRGLKVQSLTPVNTSDDVVWTVSWTGATGVAEFTNSPPEVGRHSLYAGELRIPNGPFASGTSFRLDDDSRLGGDLNDTPNGDLNVQLPEVPWSIDLPDGVTGVSIQAHLASGGNMNHAFEGLGIDMSNVQAIPEPCCGVLGLVGLLATIAYTRRYL
jgi:hypothetical protein